MLLCPVCRIGLTQQRTPEGMLFSCERCLGRSVALPVLRKRYQPDVIADLWARARATERRGDRPCPSCAEGIPTVRLADATGETEVDVCERCMLVWFDADEMRVLPLKPLPPEPERLSPQGEEALALAKVIRPYDDEDVVEVDPLSAEGLRGWTGLPRTLDVAESPRRPWLTWTVAAVIVVNFVILSFARSEVRKEWWHAWGLDPSDPWRRGGATLLTMFFLHGSRMHMIANAYFLVLAGAGIERVLGPGRLLLLLIGSTLAGSLACAATLASSTTLVLGASGGISGLFAYHALALPKTRIGLTLEAWPRGVSGRPYLSFVEVRLPVRWVFGLWFIGQCLFADLGRDMGIAYAAHIGGALGGAVWWLAERTARGAVSTTVE